MKVGLIDVDSKMPNLALMKLSTHHKNLSNNVWLINELDVPQMDMVFASKIFDFTPMPNLPNGVHEGGSGYDQANDLPSMVEECFPDYSLYDCDYAIGFTTRGCDRDCPWCIVPKKEGKFKIIGNIKKFWNGQNRIMLLDGSLNTDENHFLQICDELIVNKITTDFSQGLDIRYLTLTQAETLNRIKLWKQIHFAWDAMYYEKAVKRGIAIFDSLAMKHKCMFYVLIGFNTTPEEDLYRVETLRELKVDPFVMPFNKFDNYQRKFARWVNHKAIFKSVKWEDYVG